MKCLTIAIVVGALAACGSDDAAPAATTTTVADPPTAATTAVPTTPDDTDASSPSTTAPVTAEPVTTATEPTTTTDAQAAPTTEPEDTVPASPTPPPAGASSHVETAIADLRSRLDDPEADVTVVSVEEVDWPDGSIGCPQPGMVYTQAIVNGSKIVLLHDGVEYAYHQGGNREVFYCPPGTGKLDTPPPDLDV